MLNRRTLLKGLAALSVSGIGFGGYALAEPFRLQVTRYSLTPPNWPKGCNLRLAILTDLHVCEPWMGRQRLRQVITRTNALAPDIVLLLGDYVPSSRISKLGRPVANDVWAGMLAELNAPLGTHAILGNHDWWDRDVQARRAGPTPAGEALQKVGIPVYENDAIKLEKDGQDFWLAGLGDQWAFWPRTRAERRQKIPYRGVDDLDATLAQVPRGAPLIMMAHEPDVFSSMSDRVSLTVSGHTHGGQVQVFGYKPVVPSRYGSRYAYGHIVEDGRHLLVSSGLGVSGLPIRFGVPPEIVQLDLAG
ncbi:MAG: metallophosphoesterase [Hyphomicrobiaceae bacterium]